jgi:hypothetical protein
MTGRSPRARHARLAVLPLAMALVAGCAGAGEPTPVPIVTPAPTIDAAKAADALARFKELIASPSLTMHLESTTSLVAGVASQFGSLATSYRMDISGANFAATVFIGGQTIELRQIEGVAYARMGNAAWAKGALDESVLGDIIEPWKILGSLDALRPFARTVNPREAFVFGSSGPIDYQPAAFRKQNIVTKITSLRFTVRADGVPIDAVFNAEATAAGGKITFATNLVATRVGESITIEQPVP